MSLDSILERIAAALEKIAESSASTQGAEPAAAATAAAPKATTKPTTKPATKPVATPEPTDEPAEEPAPAEKKPAASGSKISADEVRAALKAYRDIEGAGAMLDLLKKYGADNLSALKEEHYEAIVKDAS